MNGPTLKFNRATQVVLSGAAIEARLDGEESLLPYTVVAITAGQVLSLGKISGPGARAYLAVAGGFHVPRLPSARNLPSRSASLVAMQDARCAWRMYYTWLQSDSNTPRVCALWQTSCAPQYTTNGKCASCTDRTARRIFFLDEDIDTFFDAKWEVHYNSSRTGAFSPIGPRGNGRDRGGEAGLHPSPTSTTTPTPLAPWTSPVTCRSSLVRTVRSLGGFVCPAIVVVNAELWKLGQLRPGDKIRFIRLTPRRGRAAPREARCRDRHAHRKFIAESFSVTTRCRRLHRRVPWSRRPAECLLSSRW